MQIYANYVRSRLMGDWHDLGKWTQQLINEPSMARGACVDVSVGALAVVALIHHSELDDAPGEWRCG